MARWIKTPEGEYVSLPDHDEEILHITQQVKKKLHQAKTTTEEFLNAHLPNSSEFMALNE